MDATITAMNFELVGQVTQVGAIATGRGIRTLARLKKRDGAGRWRKLKGVATVRLTSGRTRLAEVHWYESQGVGRKGWKMKRFLD